MVRGLPWSLGVNKRPTVNATSPHSLSRSWEKDHPFCLSWPQFLTLEDEEPERAILSLLYSLRSYM